MHLKMKTSFKFLRCELHQRPLFHENSIAFLSTQPALEYILKVYCRVSNNRTVTIIFVVKITHPLQTSFHMVWSFFGQNSLFYVYFVLYCVIIWGFHLRFFIKNRRRSSKTIVT